MRLDVISAKKRSTRFSDEALVVVKCSFRRGCSPSQARTSGGLMGGVIIESHMHVTPGGHPRPGA